MIYAKVLGEAEQGRNKMDIWIVRFILVNTILFVVSGRLTLEAEIVVRMIPIVAQTTIQKGLAREKVQEILTNH